MRGASCTPPGGEGWVAGCLGVVWGRGGGEGGGVVVVWVLHDSGGKRSLRELWMRWQWSFHCWVSVGPFVVGGCGLKEVWAHLIRCLMYVFGISGVFSVVGWGVGGGSWW